MAISPSTGSFGSVAIGATSATGVTFTLTNSGKGASGVPSVEVSGEYQIGTNGCTAAIAANGGTCTIVVVLAPASAGAKSGTLTVIATPGTTAGGLKASLTGNGVTAGALTVSPETHNFGNVIVGVTSSVQSFTVRNTGGAAITGVSASVNGEFSIPATGNKCGASIAANSSCVIDVAFAPTSAGSKSGTLIVSSPTATITAGLNGVGQSAAQLAISPTVQAFASVVNVQSAASTFTVANIGGAQTGALTVTITGTNAADFTVANPGCVAPLAGLGTCTIGVAFKPAAEGTKTATLTVTGTPGGTVTATLNGTANAPGSLTVTPASSDLGTATVGETKVATFTVTNSGAAPTGAVTASVSGAAFTLAGNTCLSVVLNAGDTCVVTVNWAPTAVGAASATLTVTANPGGTRSVVISGTATGNAALALSPSNANFGSIQVNASSSDTTFTVTNGGAANSGTITVTKGGTAPDQFVIAGNTCGAALAPAATCTITVRFSPTGALGDKTATLNVSATPGGAQSATLSGTSTGAPTLTFAPTSAAFNNGVLANQTAATTFVVTNGSTTATGALTTAFTGTNTADFVIVTNTCAASLLPGAGCTVQVAMNGATVGNKAAELTISGTGFTASASLTGIVRAPIEFTTAAQVAVTTLAFADTVTGRTSATNTTVKLTVRAPITALPVWAGTMSGTNASQFTFQNATGTTAVNCAPTANPANVVANTPGSWTVCDIDLRFEPQDPRGAKTATATVTSGTNTATIALSGTALSPLASDVTTKDFGTINLNANATQNFVITSQVAGGGANITAVTAVLSGDTSYSLTVNPCVNFTLTPNAANNCTITARFLPTTVGTKTASITITGTLGAGTETLVIPLTGVGQNPATTFTVTPATADLGSVEFGDTSATTFTVTNTSATLNTPALAPGITTNPAGNPYSIVMNNCVGGSAILAPGQTCTFQVQFAPLQANAIGTKAGVLTVGGTSTHALTGVAVQALTVSPASNTYAATVAGDLNGPVFTFTFTNNGGLTTGAMVAPALGGTNAGDFFIEPATTCSTTAVAAAGTCIVVVRYRPVAANQSDSATITFANAGGTLTAAATLSGTSVSEPSLEFVNLPAAQTTDFGGVRINPATPPTRTIAVKNVGGAATFGNVTVTLDGMPGASAAGCAGAPLAAGATCNVVVTYNPTVATALPATVAIASSPDANTNPLPITAGAAHGLVTGDRVQIAGHLQNTNANGIWTVTVTNATVFTIPVAGQNTGTPGSAGTIQLLNPVASDTLDVGYNKANAVAALATREGGGGALTVRGRALAGLSVASDTAPVNVGEADQNTTAAAVEVFLRNNTAGTVTLAADWTGFESNAGVFVVAAATVGAPSCANNLAITSGNGCWFKVTFTPAATAPGLLHAYLNVATTGTESPYVGFFGRVKKLGVFTVTNPAAGTDFGNQVINTTSGTKAWTVTNTGEAAITAVLVSIATGDNGMFTEPTGANNCDGLATLAVGSSCTAYAAYAPTAAAAHTSALRLAGTGDAGDVDTAITGTGKTTASVDITDGAAGTVDLVGAALNFGATNPVTVPKLGGINVRNTTATNLTTGPLSVTVQGDPAITVTGCDTERTAGMVGGAAACQLTVTYTPTTLTSLVNTTLTISATPGITQVVSITGTGTSQLVENASGLATTSKVIAPTASLAIQFNNVAGAATTGLLNAVLSGTNADRFQITANTCTNFTLAAAANCSVTVAHTHASAAVGDVAVLTVQSATVGQSVVVNLTGQ